MTDKYLENKITTGKIIISGTIMGVSAATRRGIEVNYDTGEYARSEIEKLIKQVARYYYKKGKLSPYV